MAETKTLERIYNLKVLGGDNAVKTVDSITKAITTLDAKVKQMKSIGSDVAASINKGVNDSVKNVGATNTAIGLQKTMTKEIANQRTERERLNKEMKLQAQLDAAERNSLQRAQLLINKYTAEKKKLNLATEEGRRLNESYNKAIEKANAFILKNADAETLRTKNVGNYKVVVQGLTPEIEKAVTAFERANQRASQLEQTLGKTHPSAKAARAEFEGLRRPLEDMGVQIEKVSFQSARAAQAQFSMQQVLRETPSIANGVNTYFSAISNNLPILVDNYKALRTELGSGRAAFSQILKSVFSFQTGILLGLTVLTLYGKEIANFVSGLFRGSKATSDFAEKQRLLNSAISDGNGEYAEAVKTVTDLRIKIQLAKDGFISKEKVVKFYNETIGKTTGEVSSLNEAESKLARNADAYIRFTLLKAAANFALAEAAKKAVEIAQDEINNPGKKEEQQLLLFPKIDKKSREEYTRLYNAYSRDIAEAVLLKDKETQAFLEKEQAALTERFNNAFFTNKNKRDKEQLERISADFLKSSAELAKEFKFDFFQGDLKPDDADKKNIETPLELLKATYDKERKIIETQFNDKLIDEQRFNEKLLSLNAKFRNDKLLLFANKNKEEEERRIDFNNNLAKSTFESNEALFNLEKDAIEQRFNIAIAGAERINNAVQDDPRATNLERIQAEIVLLNFRKQSQETFNNEMEALEKKYNQKSIADAQNRASAIDEINRELRRKTYEQAIATYNEQVRLSQEAANKFKNDAEIRAAQRTIDVLNSELSARQKAIAIRKIQLEETNEILAGEVAASKIALDQKEKALKDGLATEIEVSDAKKRLRQAELAYTQFTANQELTFLEKLKNGFKDVLNNLTGFFRGIKASQEEISASIAEASAIVQQAISEAKQGFFDNKRQEVDDAKEAALERLEIEQSQLESFAQSESEKESIRRQFEAKRKEAEKQAGEEKKKIAMQQLTLDFAVAVVKTLAAYPFPFSLIPVAGLGILYAIQRGIVKNTKFARGGMPQDGGDIVGPSHSGGGVPFNYEAEGGELSIINKKSATSKDKLSVTGTPRQIASAINEWGGGVRFAGGAAIRKLEYGGNLGARLQAPVNPSSFLSPGNNSSGVDSMNIVLGLVASVANSVAATNDRIDNLKVFVVAKEVDVQNTKDKKAAEIGTL